MTDPMISVVLPAYNHLKYLPAAMEDVFRQTRTDWELIVVNDGSTDGTRDWLDQQRHPKLKVIHQENRGVHEAINTGIRAANGDYVTWISADNRCAAYFLEALAAPLDLHEDCTLSYSPFFGMDSEGSIHSIKFDNILMLRELVSNAPRGNAGFMYRRSVHDRVGFYESWICDTLMWSRIIDGGRSIFVLEPTYYYRFHTDRATIRHAAAIEADMPLMMTEFLARNSNRLDGDTLLRLYPGLARSPESMSDAATDFSMRLFWSGHQHHAIKVQLLLLASGQPRDLFRPMAALVSSADIAQIDALPTIIQALEKNAALEPHQRQALRDMAIAMMAAAQADITIPPPVLENGHRLLALEKPMVFSFCAWREQNDARALPAF